MKIELPYNRGHDDRYSFDVLSFRLPFTLLWSENLDSGGQQFHQYQQNEQLPLTLIHWI